jgi:hypothetical protein
MFPSLSDGDAPPAWRKWEKIETFLPARASGPARFAVGRPEFIRSGLTLASFLSAMDAKLDLDMGLVDSCRTLAAQMVERMAREAAGKTTLSVERRLERRMYERR